MTPTTTRLLGHAAFATGLAALTWVAFGALGTNPIALVVTLVMGGFFVMGAQELRRFQLGSRALIDASASPPADGAAYDAWLAALPAPLPGAVRQRVDLGGRGALPGPSLAPTITGLLVLLGMLGTFIGMVATLHGTGMAVEHATELDALRNALAAPVKGLGLAFGTSVAGVATSAMLGLMTALARRERAEAVQALDRAIATALQPFSAAHRAASQHDETLRALQRQADAVPAMVTTMVDTVVVPLMDRLQAMMGALQQQHEQAQQQLLDGEQRLQQRLLDGQTQFHARTEAGYGALAAAVERSLKDSLAEGARQTHARLQPLLEATMGSLTREAGALHGQLTDTVQRQLEAITARLADHGATQAAQWQQALEDHRRQQQAHAEHLRGALGDFTTTFAARSETLVQDLATRLADQQAARQAAWVEQDARRLDAWRDTVTAMTRTLHDSTAAMAGDLRATAGGMATELRDAVAAMSTDLRDAATAMTADLGGTTCAMTTALRDATLAMATDLRDTASATARAHDESAARMTGELRDVVASTTAELRDTVTAMTGGLRETVAAMTGDLKDSVATMTTDLREAWQSAGDHAAARQQQICDTLGETARAITDSTQAQARATVDEIARLLQSAAEAPRAAAEVIGELRARLTDAMARDDATLRERERLMETLGTLLTAVNQASMEQRAAIEALVDTAGTLIRQAGERLQAQADQQGAALAEAATRTQASAVEVATLGETFGFAVQRFGESNESLMAQLQRIEAALSQTLARSDEQLNYYVAQAREVIDLSLSSQKQIIEDLQTLARREAA